MKTTQFIYKTMGAVMIVTAMLLGSSSAFAQVKIGSNPTSINAANNLEVEAATAGNKVSVDKTTGKVTIADGSQANESILTSDANGVATWKPKASIRVEETVFIGEQTVAPYLLTTFDGTFNSLKDRIPLTPRAGSLPGYNATTKQYVIQESGYYRVFTGASGVGTLPGPTGTQFSIYLYPWHVLDTYIGLSTTTGPVMSVYWQGYLAAGANVGLYCTSSIVAQNVQVANGFVSITKLF